MPAFNSERWIDTAVQSILSQSFRDLELIISDNASTDGTYGICERLARADSRVRLLRNERNLGVSRNYRAVFAAARGRYFKWASSSDWCAPTFIEKCVAALERDRTAVLACPRTAIFEDTIDAAQAYDQDIELLSGEPAARFIELLSKLRLNNAINGLIRRDALLRASRLGVYMSADVVLASELALMGRFLRIDERLFFRRMSIETATTLMSAREVALYLVPTTRALLRWQHWRYQFGLLRATRFAGFPRRDWFRAVGYSLLALAWSRRELALDAWHSLRPTTW
jgi:glycosyltransferase involved in cell wall biosynthesis